MRAVFRLPFRQTEGLIGSVIGLLGLDLAVPDHTTLCRRAETLEVPRPRPRSDGEPMHLLVDSTGLKRHRQPDRTWNIIQQLYSWHVLGRRNFVSVDRYPGSPKLRRGWLSWVNLTVPFGGALGEAGPGGLDSGSEGGDGGHSEASFPTDAIGVALGPRLTP